jgi:dephospho-CoA kinase
MEVFNLLTIGITGGIGSGKSTAARTLEKYGAKLILADDMAKEIVKPGMPAYESIILEFGTEILHKDGSINRKKLGDIVFSDNSKLNILNQITHVIVAEKISSQLRELRNKNKKLVVVEAIVPIEHGFLDLVDTVWVVLASEPIRIERIIKRNDITHSEAKQRVRSQMSDAMYKSIADKVIYNNGNIAELEEKVWEALKNEDYSISK